MLAIMTSFQGAEEINICLNRLDDFQPEIKPFLLSNKALHSRQALANAAAPLTGPLPSPNAAQAARHCSLHLPQPGGHAGGRQETHSPEEWGGRLLPVAEERAPELDLPPQRAALEPEGSINPQNVALGVVCSRKRRAEKKV